MKNIFMAIMLVLLCLPLVAGEWTQYYFRFELTDKAQLQDLIPFRFHISKFSHLKLVSFETISLFLSKYE